jgi:hypothetical protein
MDQDAPGSANQTLSAGADTGTPSGGKALPRCSICRKRIWSGGLMLEDPAEAPEPQRSWLLCKGCHAAVLEQLERSPVRTPVRVRVAVGLVAAERWPRARARRLGKEREDHVWIALLGWGFVAIMLLHLVIIVLLAQLAK